MKKLLYSIPCLGLLLLLSLPSVPADASNRGSRLSGVHGEEGLLPKSCRACHRGMSMAIRGEEEVCLACHGNEGDRRQMIAGGFLRAAGIRGRMADIGAELRKTYNHPVLTVRGVHRRGETLPETDPGAPRHAECVDCHNPHHLTREEPFRGIPGKRVGSFIADVTHEYELCYRCHAESANRPARSSNKHALFRTSNPSFHPVEGEGANAYVISLREPYTARKTRPGEISTITCSSCHGSDDPQGPRGPHGSRFRGLLKRNYEMETGRPESEYAYALCYGCHNRSSILGNESFPYHAQHIQGRPGMRDSGTSCYTCHDSHGSTRYPHLIRFNEDVVRPNAAGQLRYESRGVAARHGSCMLNCHGVEHAPKSY
ncbi:cytochrome C [Geoalkalibacter halelectricus]|uniref:nitrite reductase (cytochrome; ammonia-forming) n=1 Tax=Geoalkalibacter halelectricus TaxID=2847045 RepID=A0ABY5ZRN5_9BACT|nr:cytochrome c3 family protein [Geoalkalibacter halelectricus]UWZ81179.1 cytochrome C [Geoalkalibacter halelectricus]